MENIDRTHFLVLTGHLDDRPLADLIRTLRVQRKSGRLQIEYEEAPAAFFFEDGQLVDARLGTLGGLEALMAALSLPGGSFNFNPLVRPPERSIDRQQQKFISDLVEAPRRAGLSEVPVAAVGVGAPLQPAHAARQLGPAPEELLAPLELRLTAVEEAIKISSRRHARERLLYATLASFLLGAVLSAVMFFAYGSPFENANASEAAPQDPAATPGAPPPAEPPATAQQQRPAEAAPAAGGAAQSPGAAQRAETATKRVPPPKPAASPAGEAEPAAARPTARGAYVVQVRMEVENGRVTSARVVGPRPGAGDYESLALRMARQRRYPETFTGAETLRLRVSP